MFREDNGKLSFARIITGTSILASLVWITYLVIHNATMPELGGVSVFVSSVATTTYGFNKLADAVSKSQTPSSKS